MRYLITAGLILLLGISAASAVDTSLTATAKIDSFMLKGDIVDNLCAASQPLAQLPQFVKTHTKECALKPACLKSGYSIFADGKLYKFDAASNIKIAEFLAKPESKLQAMVIVKQAGKELSLVAIESQK